MGKMSKEMADAITEEYFGNGAEKFHKFCNMLLKKKKLTGLYNFDHDLVDVAVLTFVECLKTFDPNNAKGCKFSSYLYGNTYRAFYDWSRDNTRQCRCNLERDVDGKVKHDENGNVIIINTVSLDAHLEENHERLEKTDSGFRVENEIFNDKIQDSKIEKYLSRLSVLQKKIVSLLAEGYKKDQIESRLHIDSKEYNENLYTIQAYENVKFLM